MNIYLIPYTWIRHIAVALVLGGAALLTWWITLLLVVKGVGFLPAGMRWWQSVDGLLYLGNITGVIAFMSLFMEGALQRRPLFWRFLYALVAGLLAWVLTATAYGLISAIYGSLGGSESMAILKDSSLVSLRWRLPMWWLAGVSGGFGAFFARRGQGLLARYGYGLDDLGVEGELPEQEQAGWGVFFGDLAYHLLGGLLAAGFGAAIWHFCGMYDWFQGDLYLGSALGAFVWGITFGLFVWTIPNNLYAGWIRVLSSERYGLRIPIDRPDGVPSERFVGHFPRGLDLYLPGECGVAELHTSFVVDEQQRYSVRGLSQQPTLVKRFLEAIDLSYAPSRPAPLETVLSMEDRIYMGNGQSESVVEFLMLPKEEL
jgi:hypothetical protein